MATVDVSKHIPKMTAMNFTKLLRGLGINAYTVPTPKSIILSYASSARSARRETLQNLTKLLSSYKAKYVDDGRAGYTLVSTTGVKIYLKPERSAQGIMLKPNLFGNAALVDKFIPYGKYFDTVINAIDNTRKLDSPQKDLLKTLVEFTYNAKGNKQKIVRLMEALRISVPINTINNDFGEILGPIAVIQQQLLPVDIRSAQVFIPGRSNEPLLDYKIIDKNKEYKISAKSGETTNTLKPGDVKKIIDDSDFLKNKWSKSIEYAIIKELTEGSWKEGPVNAVKMLKRMKKHAGNLSWVSDKTVYTEEVRQEAENELVRLSREEIDFTPIFIDATQAKVYYVKFRILTNGDMDWKLIQKQQEKAQERKKVVFRSKNYVGRPNGDKLGFQV